MATPMTPAQRLAAYRAEGLDVREVSGWQTNDRAPVTGRPAGPKHGLVNHHTGGDTSNPAAYAAGILFRGSSALIGPLCHDGLDVDRGVLYTVGSGRTNHAGGGDPAVLAAVKAEAVPYDRELRPTKGNVDGVDGNGPFYGIEAMYSGSRDLPRVGYVALVKWNTAICRFHGWSGASAIGHREWSDDKPDPGHVNLPQLRRDIDAALALPPGVWGSATPPPTSEEDDLMGYSKEDLADAARGGVLDTRISEAGATPGVKGTGPTVWEIVTQARNAAQAAQKSAERIEALLAASTSRALESAPEAVADAAPDCAEPSEHNG